MPTREECKSNTIVQLKDMCRSSGIKGYSRMREDELIDKCCFSESVTVSSKERKRNLPGGITMVDDDPYIVYNDEMQYWAADLFKEAERKGIAFTTEDKARYLSGRIFEESPYGLHDGVMDKNAIELFEGLVGDDVEEKYMMCSNKTALQRALLESQGIETRNHIFEIIPFSYPYKPRRSESIVQMNDLTNLLLKPFVKSGAVPTFPHITADVNICEDEARQRDCEWITMDASMDNTKRLLKVRPEPDKNYYISEAIGGSIQDWKDNYLGTKPLIQFGIDIADQPLVKDAVRALFNTKWLQSPARPKKINKVM